MTDENQMLIKLFSTIQGLYGPEDLNVLEDYAVILTQPDGMPDPAPLHLCKVVGQEGVWMHSQASPSVIPGVTGYRDLDHCPQVPGATVRSSPTTA